MNLLYFQKCSYVARFRYFVSYFVTKNGVWYGTECDWFDVIFVMILSFSLSFFSCQLNSQLAKMHESVAFSKE